MRLTLQNVVVNLAYYAITVGLVPATIRSAEAALGLPTHPAIGLRAMGVVLGGAGLLLQVWCIVLFQRVGRGTPSPLVATRRFVCQGPYRWVRNPLNLGELLVFLALAAWFGSIGLLAYAGLAGLAFHAFIVLWEEPRHATLFGEAYTHYRRSVHRWLPRPPPAGGAGLGR